jgi:23S rRNA (guanosine2251-2'-O)-methyltransferase
VQVFSRKLCLTTKVSNHKYNSMKNISILILPDIRSALNVGAIFRTADAIGISKIYLTGYTPRPTDKFGRIQKDIAKSALGAETWVPWEYNEDLIKLISKLKKDGFKIIEQDKKAVDYKKIKIIDKLALIVGREVEGLDKKTLKKCDSIIHIPMYGKKESLNVSVATGIALYRLLDK